MKKPWLPTLLAGIAFAVLPANAQRSDDSQAAPRAHVAQITDQRTADSDQSPGCTVDLTFSGGGAEHSFSTRNVRIDQAVDEFGHDLKTGQPRTSGGIFSLHLKSGRPLELEILLNNPPRKSTLIKELRGQVQLFSPTVANGGLVVCPDFSSARENPALEKYQIRVLNLTPPDFKSLKNNPRKEILNAARKAGLTAEEIRWLKGDLREASGFSTPPDPAKTLLIYRQDPKNLIVQAEVQDPHGQPVRPVEIDGYDNLSLLFFDADLPANFNLALKLAVPGAIRECPFDFHDLPLP